MLFKIKFRCKRKNPEKSAAIKIQSDYTRLWRKAFQILAQATFSYREFFSRCLLQYFIFYVSFVRRDFSPKKKKNELQAENEMSQE